MRDKIQEFLKNVGYGVISLIAVIIGLCAIMAVLIGLAVLIDKYQLWPYLGMCVLAFYGILLLHYIGQQARKELKLK